MNPRPGPITPVQGEDACPPILPAVAADRGCWVGIDVAKAHLDIATWPVQDRLRVTREAGWAALSRLAAPRDPDNDREATGGLETLVAGTLIAAEFPTDKPVKMLPFGYGIQPTPRPWNDEETQAPGGLICFKRRRQLVTMLTAEKNHLASAH